ncbi:MAG: FkbM family methyltransferase [Actinomycetota bacterium]|nr:FkbM family methyltransferase [Actinomycetota bacterium]
MATLTSLIRKIVEKGPDGLVEAGRRRSREGMARAIVALLRRVPVRMLLAVKTSLSPVVRLDYEGDEILLQANSEFDLMRAQGCSKEPHTVRWIENHVRAGDVFYDIGANVGAYAMVAARQAPGQVVSHAFEPSYSTYNSLCNNVILNGYQNQVFPHLIALGEENGRSVLNYHSLVAGTALHAVGSNVSFQNKTFDPVYRQQIFVFSLDDLVLNWGFEMPTHMKIDVDGTELDVLLGARKILGDPQLRTVLVEVCHDRGHAEDIHELMTASGFVVESEVYLQPTVSNRVYTRETD